MRDDFTFDCPECSGITVTNRTSSGEPIPRYDDNPKEFYVTCAHCYNIYRVEYIVVLTEMMNSNLSSVKRAVVSIPTWNE